MAVEEDDLSKIVESIRSGFQPALSIGEDRPYDAQDFTSHQLEASLRSLQTGLRLVTSSNNDVINGNPKALMVPILLLCGEHTDPTQPWTRQGHVKVSYQVLSGLKRLCRCDSVAKIIVKDEGQPLSFFLYLLFSNNNT